jgi:hypothetical protein
MKQKSYFWNAATNGHGCLQLKISNLKAHSIALNESSRSTYEVGLPYDLNQAYENNYL